MENSKKGYTLMIEKPDYRKSQGAKIPSEQNPVEIHWTVVKTILKYLRNTKDMVLVYGSEPEVELESYTQKVPRKAYCYVFIKNAESTLLGVGSKWKASGLMEILLMIGDVVPSNKRHMEMLCDNEPAILIANNLGILKGARHLQRKYHYIRDVIQERENVLKKVYTYDNVTDPFTKPMSFNKHYEHAMAIRIVPGSSLMLNL
ncbi:hypothetical protein Tco_0059004 [Tanacetum coccineum]